MINTIVLLALTIVSVANYAKAQAEGDLRLVGGPTHTSGRVEIYHAGEWGTVCNDRFGGKDARVVCTQLGLANTKPVVWRDAPAGTGTILLDDLGCHGNEPTLSDCRHQPWCQHNCAHRDDAGVECDTHSYVENMRLVGGTERSGRLEVNYGGTWGPVCAYQFSNDDAQVACRTMGFDGNGAQRTLIYGRGTESELLANVNCNGNEVSMSDCRYTGPFGADRYCGRGGHVGLNCLVFLKSSTEHAIVYSFSLTHQRLPIVNIWLDDVVCNGTEQSLVECDHRDWRTHNSNHQDDVGVFCTTDDHAGHYHQIRLAGANSTTRGRIEVNYYGIWGTVCDDRWRESNTEVVCRSLNLPFDNAVLAPVGDFGPRDGPIWMDDVQCGGNELSIFDCPHAALGVENCGHREDVAVICEW